MSSLKRIGEVKKKMVFNITRRGIAGVVAGTALALTMALAPNAYATDFSGERVRIVVPFSAGGGTDSLTRALVPFMEKHLPGNPKILVVNKPGAGGIIGANYFEQNAEKDGTWVMAMSLSTVMNYLLNDPRVEFDMQAWEHIIVLPRGDINYARTELGLAGLNPKDLVAKMRSIPADDLVFGGMTPTDAGLKQRLALSLLGVETKNVWGMGGAGPISQAFERGEFALNFENSLAYLNQRKHFRDSGISMELWTHGAPDADGNWKDAEGNWHRDPTWPDVPTFYEVYEDGAGGSFDSPAGQATLALLKVGTLTNKSFHLPAGADEGAKEAWWQAMRDVMEDPEFIELRSNVLGEYTATIGPAAKTAIDDALTLSPEARAYIREFAKERYDLDLNL
ncbi:Bug family tripartite tricarboxylate transporter substrate binding protein [Oricola indica]|uniref:Bug family tripartite tricarboxylate transporter substrate binding protein n=1 Tax=Oricola indica TaxID=2872591 RepID=UPI003CCBD908